ncbi:hypothetical protein BN126340025 [Stenotrophomonas thermophila]|nr:hypothetical protein BN126340025 [Stenotrophomonas maltophilia]
MLRRPAARSGWRWPMTWWSMMGSRRTCRCRWNSCTRGIWGWPGDEAGLPASGRHYQSVSTHGVDLLDDSVAGQRPALPKRIHARRGSTGRPGCRPAAGTTEAYPRVAWIYSSCRRA